MKYDTFSKFRHLCYFTLIGLLLLFQVIDAYAMIDDGGLGEKVQNCFVQIVVLETHSVLKNVLYEVHNHALDELIYFYPASLMVLSQS
mgnify:FL=1